MSKHWLLMISLVGLLLGPTLAQEGPGLVGPAKVDLKSGLAQLDLPEGYLFLNKAETEQFLKQTGNIPDGGELGSVLLNDENEGFWVLMSYEETGFVKDDEASKLDADAMLKDFQEGTDAANEERAKEGMTPVKLIGWGEKPRYEAASHHLIWALTGESDGTQVVNYNTRVLGRSGVMSLNLICSPDDLERYKPKIESLLKRTTYSEGKRYADFQEGDPVSEAGLLALVAGGAAAAKLGLFAKIGKFLLYLLLVGKKFIVVAFIAAGAFFKRFFGGKSDVEAPADSSSESPPLTETSIPESSDQDPPITS